MMKSSNSQQAQCDERRRSFLKLSGALGMSTLATALLPASQAEAVLFGHREYKVTKTRLAMGTYVSMTAIHSSRDEAEEAIGLAFQEVDRLCGLLSRHDAASPVAQLNAMGYLKNAPLEVLELVARSLRHHRQSGGVFDITVKPILDLYQERFAAGEKPDDHDLRAVLNKVGSHKLGLADGGVRFGREGMGITLDGIAKGYIVDRASMFLADRGVRNHLINAGGDIRTSGTAAKGAPWTVAIQDPAKGRDYPSFLRMGDGAVATSGDYEVYYDREKVFHHIVNSGTGRSPELYASVTVLAPSVMDADALSTSVFVMEPDAGLRYIDSRPGCQCFVVGRDGSTRQSAGWASRV
jgi:thiamine biosynthesis lipoprotein